MLSRLLASANQANLEWFCDGIRDREGEKRKTRKIFVFPRIHDASQPHSDSEMTLVAGCCCY